MASMILSGDTSGTVTLSAPLVAGSNTATLPAATGTVALTSDVIGVGQTWQDVTASRALATTYTNSTGKPIEVMVYGVSNASVANNLSLLVNGNTINVNGNSQAGGINTSVSAIVPNGSTYRVNTASVDLTKWSELR